MRRNLIVVGASAGGVEALRALVAGVPADLPAAILVVLHIPSNGGSLLPAILSRAGPMPAHHAVTAEILRPGAILVAPPDRHLLVDDGRARLTSGPPENGHRPAIDVLFRSAALSAGPRVIAVVLSGVLDDGTAGLTAVSARGGVSVVQDPTDALHSAMPRSALEHVPVDRVVAAAEIGSVLVELVHAELPEVPARHPRRSTSTRSRP